MWKKISKNNLREICRIYNKNELTIEESKKIELLKELISKYNFVEFNFIDRTSPLISALRDGNYKRNYQNPKNDKNFLHEYGTQNPTEIVNEILDHGIAFRNNYGKIFYIGNPYMEEQEISEILDSYINKTGNLKLKGWTIDLLHGKNYENLKYNILGKNKSYYNPNKTNLVVLYY